jgi:hypothetical protein
LASNIVNNFRVPKSPEDPVLKNWLTQELKDLKIDPKFLITVISKMGRDSF